MAWTYNNRTGELRHNGQPFLDKKKKEVVGYSGWGLEKQLMTGRNNPTLQCVENVGPIPSGKYKIGRIVEAYLTNDSPPKLFHFAIPLTPIGHNMCGRSGGFLIHGDSTKNYGNASRGCIILNRDIRKAIDASTDKILVVEGPQWK